MQGNEIASALSSAFAEALSPFASTCADVLTTLPDLLAGAGLNVLLLALRHGLRLGGLLILRRWSRKRGQTQENQHARCRKHRGEFSALMFIFSLLLSHTHINTMMMATGRRLAGAYESPARSGLVTKRDYSTYCIVTARGGR